jgi:uncharacterized membrane protein
VILDQIVRWLHLLAAAVWIGGMIVIGAVVGALRRAGATSILLGAMARRFGTVAWSALGLATATGIVQVVRAGHDLSPALAIKISLVGLAAAVAFAHQFLARDAGPALRGALEGASLLIGLGILAAAVAV